jgi:hypothetical protein
MYVCGIMSEEQLILIVHEQDLSCDALKRGCMLFPPSLHFEAALANPLAEALGQPRPTSGLGLVSRGRSTSILTPLLTKFKPLLTQEGRATDLSHTPPIEINVSRMFGSDVSQM